MQKVLVTRRLPQPALDRLAATARVVLPPTGGRLAQGGLLELSRGCAAVLATLDVAITREFLSARPGVKIVANFAVGYDNIDLEAARDMRVVITNTPHVLTTTTADCALALILACARRVVEGDREVRSGRFGGISPLYFLGADLGGKVLGIYGMGRIGQAVAQRARAFDMDVIYHNRKHGLGEKAELGTEYASFDELLARSDFISINAPLTPETNHAFDYKAFDKMKPSAFIVNTGRGPIIKEADLVRALKEKLIAGAGLDVYEREPEVHPGLLDLPNVVLTPHIGSATWECRTKMALLAVENIEAFFRGGENYASRVV